MNTQTMRNQRKAAGAPRKWLAVLTALTLVLSLGFSTVSTTFAASAANSTAEDSVVTLLASMGVLTAGSDGSYHLGNTITRAEFAKMLVEASTYKDLVAGTAKTSPFSDVKGSHWAAPYIKIAANKGLLSGYSDGTFRPDHAVTLEQAANAALKLLGYEQSDFAGVFPYAQINLYESTGLSQNITGGIGTTLTKRDAANLIYNMMGTDLKDGSKKYAETLGYALNSSGEVDYADVVSSNMQGPYTVKSSNWAAELGMNTGTPIIYKNGIKADASDVNTYDILYYSKSKGTVWAYDDRVVGVYEKASPSQNAVTSVTVSGKEYSLESSAAFAALSSTGTLKIGDGITLLLGKDGGVADAVSADLTSESTAIYVTETGTKTLTDAKGNDYTSYYFKGVTPRGTEMEYASTQEWVDAGDMVTVSYENGGVRVSSAGSSLSGKVDASLRTIGAARVASDAFITDTYDSRVTSVSLSRLDGMTLSDSEVLYYKAENGEITELVLNDATGDAREYGILTKAKSSGSNMSLSGSYTYDLNGTQKTLNTQNSSLGVGTGPMVLVTENGEVTGMRNLSAVSGRVTAVDSSSVTAGGKTYSFAYDVVVYTKDSSGNYKTAQLSDAAAAGSKASFYYDYDRGPDAGGRIRIIVIPQ